MASYFSSITNFLSPKKVAKPSKVEESTLKEKILEAEKDEFVYMHEGIDCPDLEAGMVSNTDILGTAKGQLYNAKGELLNGLGHAAYAAGNVALAGSHGAALVVNIHNAFAIISHLAGQLNELKTTLDLAVKAEKFLQKAEDRYNNIVGNPVTAHKATKLDTAYDYAKQADEIFHENTGYLAMALNAIKTFFYPENLVGFASRSKKAIENIYQAVKCGANSLTALAKAGYYKAKDVFDNSSDDSLKATELSEDDQDDNALNGSVVQEDLGIELTTLGGGDQNDRALSDIELIVLGDAENLPA